MSALFLGISQIAWLARDEDISPLRQSVSASIAASMAALALFGLWDFVHGGAGLGIWVAIAV